MAAGTPVICSDIPVLREVAGDTATYANPKDDDDLYAGLETAILEPAAARARAQTALARAKSFTWDNSADALARLYRTLVSK
ncbi:MAG: glycosyltransferase [Candidatus Hydrogenedentes bacterium]|nr:glycosyltransferase [Candidatus Hydrogenedentota bacterium]